MMSFKEMAEETQRKVSSFLAQLEELKNVAVQIQKPVSSIGKYGYRMQIQFHSDLDFSSVANLLTDTFKKHGFIGYFDKWYLTREDNAFDYDGELDDDWN